MGNQVTIVLTQTDAVSGYALSNKIVLYSMAKEIRNIPHPHFKIIKLLSRIISSENPDCVLSFYLDVCALTAISLMNKKIPLIYSERNDPNRTNQRKIEKIYRKIVEFNANGFVFQTDGAKKSYGTKIQEKSIVILNPLNIESLPVREEKSIEKVIVSVGRLVPQKRQDLLIDAFEIIEKTHPNYVLNIYGSGELEEQLAQRIASRKIQHVYLKGNSKDVLEKIKNSSLFVLTSDYEGIPNALLEAMAIGIPSISTDCSPGGARMLIEDGVNGFIVPCGNVNELATKMELLLDDHILAKAFSKQSVLIRNQVDPELIAEKWISYIRRIKESY